ncbi:hypothetical protein BDZ94DRAFT_1233828 [Collybia nuda]|uniref:Uncharacterized protein n=1 Tax=Collybia nuda TaxID=64659 RepID=A0A9P5YFC7_9AGAR|nr:hypothetical protein BDZ94DRAFT_1233828 [Collybia nuda]
MARPGGGGVVVVHSRHGTGSRFNYPIRWFPENPPGTLYSVACIEEGHAVSRGVLIPNAEEWNRLERSSLDVPLSHVGNGLEFPVGTTPRLDHLQMSQTHGEQIRDTPLPLQGGIIDFDLAASVPGHCITALAKPRTVYANNWATGGMSRMPTKVNHRENFCIVWGPGSIKLIPWSEFILALQTFVHKSQAVIVIIIPDLSVGMELEFGTLQEVRGFRQLSLLYSTHDLCILNAATRIRHLNQRILSRILPAEFYIIAPAGTCA